MCALRQQNKLKFGNYSRKFKSNCPPLLSYIYIITKFFLHVTKFCEALRLFSQNKTDKQKQKQVLALTTRTASFSDLHMKSGSDFQAVFLSWSKASAKKTKEVRTVSAKPLRVLSYGTLHFILIVVVLSGTEHEFRTNTLPRSRPKPKQTNSRVVNSATSHASDRDDDAAMKLKAFIFPAVSGRAPTRIQFLYTGGSGAWLTKIR